METERGRRELTVFLREKKDILLGLIDGMIGGDGRRGGVERERKGTSKRLTGIRQTSKQSCTLLHSHGYSFQLIIASSPSAS